MGDEGALLPSAHIALPEPAVVGSRQDQDTLLLSKESCLCVNSPVPTTKYLMTNHVLRGRIERYEVALTIFQVHVG